MSGHAISVDVEPGEIAGILGANGAGKTTTLLGIHARVPPRQRPCRDSTASNVDSLNTAKLVRPASPCAPRTAACSPTCRSRTTCCSAPTATGEPVQQERLAATYERFEWIGERRSEARRQAQRRPAADRRHRQGTDVEPQGRAPRRTVERAVAGRDRQTAACSNTSQPAARLSSSSNRTSSSCSAVPASVGPRPRHRQGRRRRRRTAQGARVPPMPTSVDSTSSRTSHRRPPTISAPLRGGTDMITTTNWTFARHTHRDRCPVVGRPDRTPAYVALLAPRLRRAHRALRPRRRGARRPRRRRLRARPHRPRSQRRRPRHRRELRRRRRRPRHPRGRGRGRLARASRGPHRPLDGRHDRRPLRPALTATGSPPSCSRGRWSASSPCSTSLLASDEHRSAPRSTSPCCRATTPCRRGLRRRPARVARVVPAADGRGDGGDGRAPSTTAGSSARCRCCGCTASTTPACRSTVSRVGIERLRGDTFARARVPRSATRGVQRDQLRRGARRRDRLPRPLVGPRQGAKR